MRCHGGSKTAEGCDVLRLAWRLPAVIGMTVIQNPERPHAARLQSAQKRVVTCEAIPAIAFHVRPEQVHAHKAEAQVLCPVERTIVTQDMNVDAKPRREFRGCRYGWIYRRILTQFEEIAGIRNAYVIESQRTGQRGARPNNDAQLRDPAFDTLGTFRQWNHRVLPIAQAWMLQRGGGDGKRCRVPARIFALDRHGHICSEANP